jgi:molecular chaperone GrpE
MTEHKKHHKIEDTAADSAATVALQADLEKTNAQAAEYLDGWKRAQAELINYRKRVERDAVEVHLQAAARAAARWFPILDDLERALREAPAEDGIDQWKAGLEIILRKGLAALEAEGITVQHDEPGAHFDPNRHEAVTMEPCPDQEDGEILAVIRRGYCQGEKVLRPAQVRVACKPQAAGEG